MNNEELDDDLDWVVEISFTSEHLTLEEMRDALGEEGDFGSWNKGDLSPDCGQSEARHIYNTSRLHLWDECDSWENVKRCLAQRSIPVLTLYKEKNLNAVSSLTFYYFGEQLEVSFKLPSEIIACCALANTSIEVITVICSN